MRDELSSFDRDLEMARVEIEEGPPNELCGYCLADLAILDGYCESCLIEFELIGEDE